MSDSYGRLQLGYIDGGANDPDRLPEEPSGFIADLVRRQATPDEIEARLRDAFSESAVPGPSGDILPDYGLAGSPGHALLTALNKIDACNRQFGGFSAGDVRRGRTLFDSSEPRDDGILDYRPERDGPSIDVPLPIKYDDPRSPEPVYYGSDDAMPVFKPSEVSSDPEPQIAPRAAAEAVAAPEPPGDEARETAYENALPELGPFVSIGGKERFPYLATMTGATSREIADIARKQYPGATVRTGVTGAPLITLPPDATQIRMKTAPSWGDGPDFALEEVPVGGQEFQLNAPGVTLRDVANGGSQTALDLLSAFGAAEAPAWAVARLAPKAANAIGVASGVGKYFGADKLLDRETWAKFLGSN